MKIGILRKSTSFWRSLFFMDNVSKMRKCLMGYLEEEGIRCELVDGNIIFEFNGNPFTTSFVVNDGFSECFINFYFENDNYEKLNLSDKTYIADKVNADKCNHAIVYAFEGCIQVTTSFYFTSKNMMIDLFSNHFEELTESIDEAVTILCSKMEEQKKVQNRRIGFNTEPDENEDAKSDMDQVSAKG